MNSLLEQEEITPSKVLSGFQSAMVDQWSSVLEAARKSREPFMTMAHACRGFYARDCGFMWQPSFRDKFLKGVKSPKFEVTINKAFELVAIYGPYLLWDNPYRKCQTYEPFQVEEEFLQFEADGSEEYAAALQQVMFEQQRHTQVAEIRAQLQQRYLNYSSREQREKLSVQGGYAVIDALITGRGCLWPETYSHPGSDRTLTGLFWDKVDNLLIDPDCTDPGLKTATWIARRHVNTTWEVERRFKLKKGSLKGKGVMESNASGIANADNKAARREHKTHDLMVWYEIWSRGGVGTRQVTETGHESMLHNAFEESLGDFAYLCICPSVPYFLNAPAAEMVEFSEDEVIEKMSWPFPAFMDGRWPVAMLDFNKDMTSCWPIAPLSPAMGELITLNILVSVFLENAYENRTQIVAVLESAAKEIEQQMENGSAFVKVKLKDNLNRSINEVVQYLNKPGMNRDIMDAIAFVMNMFDKRTGLVEFMYAQSSSQDRSATTTRAKEEKAGIRPDKMSRDVAEFMTEASELERILACMVVESKDIPELLGPMGAYLWDTYITDADPESIVREATATVEASDIRRPNKQRETENMQAMLGYMLPMLQQYAAMRGDDEGVRPLNAFLRSFGSSIEQDTTDWVLQEFQPPPDEVSMQIQQMMAQLEMQQKQADVEKTTADTEKTRVDAAVQLQQAQTEGQRRQLEFDWAQVEHLAQLKQSQDKHRQQLVQNAVNFQQKGAMMRAEAALRQARSGV